MRNLRLVHSSTWVERSSPPAPRRREDERALRALDPAVQAMVEHVRIVAPLPQIVRARALARARAVIAAKASLSSAFVSPPSRHRGH